MTNIDVAVDIVYVLSDKIGCHDTRYPNVIGSEVEPVQVSAFQVECEFVRRFLFGCVDGAVEYEREVRILDLDLPFEHFRASSPIDRESPVGIPVHNRLVHLYIQLRFYVIFV